MIVSDTFSLTSKVAIVTGSGRENGIGAAIARALARNGSALAIHHVSEASASRAQAVAQGIVSEGGQACVVQADITSPAGAKKLVAETMRAFGVDKVDILVNNAGICVGGDLLDATPEQMLAEFNLNTFAPLYMVQAVVKEGRMPRGGRIINIGTVASKLGHRGVAGYGASKAAEDSMTEALAGELGRSHGITVNTVAPGPILTDIVIDARKKLGTDPTKPLRSIARGSEEIGQPEDVARMVLWLATENSSWITAQYISCSAGINGTS
ncbi:Putative short-chain dehydrogenase/reductase SDR, NAD(P)-binding domain superfamily [Colletotrichum destructivum]|uniref:Short-chain dehydrogenase/reductase SDR, NAD(P)-binding domain superfamily n=1 Tax=Colletotrichum destructivum TaxID=34406 RepID=A0AAX4HZS9_9PEZI|nr:Putative short-chain dehydrogenase/reductase SDR, NAD(P)-binding domain superfamily [Colletotrichum destructivum]